MDKYCQCNLLLAQKCIHRKCHKVINNNIINNTMISSAELRGVGVFLHGWSEFLLDWEVKHEKPIESEIHMLFEKKSFRKIIWESLKIFEKKIIHRREPYNANIVVQIHLKFPPLTHIYMYIYNIYCDSVNIIVLLCYHYHKFAHMYDRSDVSPFSIDAQTTQSAHRRGASGTRTTPNVATTQHHHVTARELRFVKYTIIHSAFRDHSADWLVIWS